MSDNIRFGYHEPTTRFGLKSNNNCKSDDTKDCGIPDTPEEYHDDHKCYTNIQEIVKNSTKDSIKQIKKLGVNECIDSLNKQLRCDNNNNNLKCENWFYNPSIKGGFTDKTRNACKTPDNAMNNIVNFCINKKELSPEEICHTETSSKLLRKKKYDNTSLNELRTSDTKINCGDNCNNDKIEGPKILKSKYDGTMSSNIADELLTKYDKNLTCNEMSKIIKDCKELNKNDNGEFDRIYNKFLSGHNLESIDNINDKERLTLLKLGMCKIASDNIDIIKGDEKIDTTITDWWDENIFGNSRNSFQKNIYYISFFIVLYLKLKILSKFSFSIKQLNKIKIQFVLPIICILFSIIILYGFINSSPFIVPLSKFVFKASVFSILIGFTIYIINNIIKSSKLFGIFLLISIILLLIQSSFGYNNFTNVMLLLYFLLISIFFILKSERNTMLFQLFSILIIVVLVIIYIFFNDSTIISIIYYYVIVFCMLIFIIVTNNNSGGNFEKLINIRLKPFSEKPNPLEIISQICYIVFALLDCFISVLSPQMSLVIMFVFRLILNRWFEPINAIFASLSGYGMISLTGSQFQGFTGNMNILNFNSLIK